MTFSRRMLMAAAGRGGALDVADAFSTDLYTGNGSTQSIVNGIDLSGEGGLVWVKDRGNASSHGLFDTLRGANTRLITAYASATQTIANSLTSFNSDGFSLGSDGASGGSYNGSAISAVSWTFRQATKFFDVVTYTGTGSARTIPHSLGAVPGMIIVKRTDATADWQVYHRANTANPETDYLVLNTTAATADSDLRWNDTAPTTSVFSLGTDATVNASGGTYVAYLFAHDTSASGIVQCVSVTTDGSGNASYAHGWTEGVQFVMLKCSTTTGDWEMFDTARSPSWATDLRLRANLLNAEDTVTRISDTGGTISFANLSASQTYILLLIRGES
jgi:hypothetical protein